MKKNHIRRVGAVLLAALWLGLSLWAWLRNPDEISNSERRKLAQFPALSAETIKNGTFMTAFEDYSLDQFPLRDAFRQMKSLFHYNVLMQKDNHGIYLADGFAAKLDYPLDTDSVNGALQKFQNLYETYLSGTDSQILFAVVPDKGYYLAEANGYPAMDYEALFSMVRSGTPWARYVDLTDTLTIDSYYRTDTHWRQEALLGTASKLCGALGVAPPEAGAYTVTTLDTPFYGVYYGQAALPMAGETICLLENDVTGGCTVYNYENGKTTSVYDLEKLTSRDLYDVYLSGAAALLTIENPNAATDRELIVFRDSFGSSILPLLLGDYKTVTVIDTRYIAPSLLGQFVDFHGQDVLFLYSTMLLNSSSSLK